MWKCKDANTSADVAVKIIKPPKNDKRKKWIRNEITLMQKCNHDNIPRFIASLTVANNVWLAMEYVDGMDLLHLMDCITFRRSQIAYVCAEVLSALSYLHSNGIIQLTH